MQASKPQSHPQPSSAHFITILTSPPILSEEIPLEDQTNAATGSTDTLNGRQHSPPTQEQRPLSLWRRLKHNLKPLRGVMVAWLVFCVFSVVFSAFIVHVLLRGNVRVGRVTFDATTSNLLVSIFSQISVILGDTLIRDLLGVIRLALARREQGVSALTYFVIGPASAWTEAARHAVLTKCYRLNLWCDFRVLLPIMGLALGSVLKFEAQFDYHFAPGNTNMTVYAGLIPIEMLVVNSRQLTPADLSMYFYSLTSNLLLDSRYAIQQGFPGCSSKQCRSVMLPGGVETARQYHPSKFLNHTIFEGGIFEGSESIQIEHAPGMLAKFERLPEDFDFDPAGCVYAGERINNTLVMCAQQLGQSLAVGWAACPIKEFTKKTCSREVTWTSGPIQYSTNVSVFEQYTRTAYSRNFSIVNVELTSPVGETQIALKEDDYRTIFRKALSSNTTDRSDLSNMDALVHQLTWLHRTYDNSFPDDQQRVLTSLHNFIGVSLQFMVTAVQFANYTTEYIANTDLMALPDKMVTSAVSGSSMQKLSIQTWTGIIFILTEGLIVLLTALAILLILLGAEGLPPKSSAAEIDILTNAGTMQAAEISAPRLWGWWPFRGARNEATPEAPVSEPASEEDKQDFLAMAQTLANYVPPSNHSTSWWAHIRGFVGRQIDKERKLLEWVVFLPSNPNTPDETVEERGISLETIEEQPEPDQIAEHEGLSHQLRRG